MSQRRGGASVVLPQHASCKLSADACPTAHVHDKCCFKVTHSASDTLESDYTDIYIYIYIGLVILFWLNK